jgi:hypothetical protein
VATAGKVSKLFVVRNPGCAAQSVVIRFALDTDATPRGRPAPLPERARFPRMVAVRPVSLPSGIPMTDDLEMRLRLQQVAVYRDLCRRVRRSGRENVVFAAIMLFLAFLSWKNPGNNPGLILYTALAIAELLVGVFKLMAPSAEGVLLDGIVLLLFAGYNFLGFVIGPQPPAWVALLGLFILMGAFGRFKDYRLLRLLFAERPRAEHMAWFDGLVREIKAADPNGDELALDLPTSPHWKAKLLGAMAFFVTLRGNLVLVGGPDDFEIRREKVDHGTGRRRAILRIYDTPYPEFEISDASWENYQKWRASNPLPQPTAPAAGA